MAAFQVINIQMQSDLLALGSKLEIAHPHRQGLHNVEAIEFQFHLTILNLTEIKNVTYQLLESKGITLHHFQEFAAFALDAGIFEQHLYRVGYQG